MRKLLVTGGAGFIGTNFVYYWLNKYPNDKIIVIDSLSYSGNKRNLLKAEEKNQFEFVRGDILDQGLVENVLKEYEIDTIVHFAAESHVDRSIFDPDKFINTNIVGTHSLLKAARKLWIGKDIFTHRFHHVSTDEVYGSLKHDDPPFTEKTVYSPNSPYAATKAASDHLVRAYYKTYGLQITLSNCSNNYGPFQYPEKLIPLIITNILDGKQLPIYGDGLNIRDWLYVDDHNLGIDLILNRGKVGETYNIGGNSELTNLDIVKYICGLIDQMLLEDKELKLRFPKSPPSSGNESTCLIQYVRDRAGHDKRYAIDANKIHSDLEYSPRESIETGMKKTVIWFLENESWWRKLMDKEYASWISRNYN